MSARGGARAGARIGYRWRRRWRARRGGEPHLPTHSAPTLSHCTAGLRTHCRPRALRVGRRYERLKGDFVADSKITHMPGETELAKIGGQRKGWVNE